MAEHTLFSLAEAERLKSQGMLAAAGGRGEILEFARGLAVGIAASRESRECTADDVHEALAGYGLAPDALGPAAGSLFKGATWSFTGRRVISRQPRNRCRELKVWRLTIT